MRPAKRRMPLALLLFTLAYLALNLLPRELGHRLSMSVCDFAAALVDGSAFDYDLVLQVTPAYSDKVPIASTQLDKDMAWTAALYARRISNGASTTIGINLRKSLWVPFTVFASLALASALYFGVRSLIVLIVGGIMLEILLVVAMVMHACAVLYEKYVIDLSRLAQAAVRFSHSLLEPPGMVYALPVALWAALTFIAGQPQPVTRLQEPGS
jgi:hypothetical protein